MFRFLDIDDEDESISLLRQKCIEQGATCADGSVPVVTHTICNFLPPDSRDASRFEYGSPFWVYRLLTEGRFDLPHHPLDFPIPIDPIEPTAPALVISSTGFSLSERELIEAMITLAGAIFTSHLTCRNTHLIVPVKDENAPLNPSEKERYAVEWGVEIRDVAWLERCFLNWKWES